MKTKRIEAGDVFTRWTVIEKAVSIRGKTGGLTSIWLCKCDCGISKKVRAIHLRSGRSASCGCLHKEIASASSFKHGDHKSPMYVVWCAIVQRCKNPKNKSFKNYGARGITVCPEWHEYAAFLRDMGPTYQSGLTIDRKENDGGYEPGNCHWVTNKVNCRNQQRSIRVEWNGVLTALNDLAEAHGVRLLTAYSRFKLKGWTLRQSLGLDAPPKLVRKPITEETRQRMSISALKRGTRSEGVRANMAVAAQKREAKKREPA